MRRRAIVVGVLLALLALFPFAGATFYTQLVTKMMILAIFAMSLDLLVGYTGLVCLGHAAYFGLGRLRPRLPHAAVRSGQPVADAAAPRSARSGLAALAIGVLGASAPRASTSSW